MAKVRRSSNRGRRPDGKGAPTPNQGAGFSTFDGSTFFDDTTDRKISVASVESTNGVGLGAANAIGPNSGTRVASQTPDVRPVQVSVTVTHTTVNNTDPKTMPVVITNQVANFFVADVCVILTLKPNDTTKRRLLVVAQHVRMDNLNVTTVTRAFSDEV